MRTKKYGMILLSCVLLFAAFPLTTLAKEDTETSDNPGTYQSKDEVIYANLHANGKTKDMYIVNSFDVKEPGEIADYGPYTDVRNLTDLSDIEIAREDEVHFQANEDEFYYQGELDNQPLPWDISITYVLDGKEVNPDELVGQSGDFEIQIETSENDQVDPVFYEHFLMQISLTLDPEIFSDIQAPKGTEANEGKNKQMTFTVLPDQDEVLILSADVTNFEIDPIEIAATPANIGFEEPDIGDMKGDMQELTDAIAEIHSGVIELKDGISELYSGANELSEGSAEYLNGVNEVDQSSAELVQGSKEIRDALQQISTEMQNSPDIPDIDMEELEVLPEALREIAKGLRESSGSFDFLEEAIQDIPEINDEQLEQLIEAISEDDPDGELTEIVNQLIGTYGGIQEIQAIYEDIQGDLKAFTEQAGEMANQLEWMADEIENGLQDLGQLDGITELQTGLTTLSSEYNTFHEGLIEYTDGVHSLATSYKEIHAGIQELPAGISSLEEGAAELAEGTKELKNSTSDLPSEMQAEIDEFMEDYDFADFEPTSFVSDKNENMEVVQFVLQTEEMEIEENDTDDEEQEEDKGMWDRFLDLFK